MGMGIWTEADTNLARRCRLREALAILTSNLHPARFDTIFPKGLATAAVDRLLHHAHVIISEGQSHRLAEALDGCGVTSLDAPTA